MSNATHPALAVNIKDGSVFQAWGSRVAQARKERGNRGLAPAPAQHVERIGAFPKPQQKFVIQMIELALAGQTR
jgi:hypothetical protein